MGRHDEFERFFEQVEPRLRRAFVATHGIEGAADATAEAMAWAWERWDQVRMFDNPAGYLYRVGQSRSRTRRVPELPSPSSLRLPDFEPRLVPALQGLSPGQRTAVWLVHACGWRQVEVAEAMGISPSAVSTHVARGLEHLRQALAVNDRA